MFGDQMPELQLVAMRCGQVAGVGGAEWTHKVMNAILSAKRHRTHWDRVEDYMYIKINGDMLDKVSTYDYEEKVTCLSVFYFILFHFYYYYF